MQMFLFPEGLRPLRSRQRPLEVLWYGFVFVVKVVELGTRNEEDARVGD
jgi:hypothetical protein